MDDSSNKLDRLALEKVSRVFGAFSDATRLAILQCLKNGPASVGELKEEVGSSQGNISKQLKILFDAGLLAREKDGNQVFYSISDDMVFKLCSLACEKLNRDADSAIEFSFEI